MRDFRIQGLIDILRVLQSKELSFEELVDYLGNWFRPMKKRPAANKIFDSRDFGYFKKIILKLGKEDPLWFPRLIEPSTLGIRSWEYGLLLTQVSFKNKTVLDAGAGNSRLPKYLANKGAMVTMLDMEQPLEETRVKQDKNLRFVLGDMTRLKFKNNTFDRVVCISAIEHVDMKAGGKFYSSREYFQRAKDAIQELVRVTKKGGVFYLTTDFYLPRQRTDKWFGSGEKFRGAFPWSQISCFIEEMEMTGIKLNSAPFYDEKILLDDRRRSNYRGRYFSTFAFMGRKI